MPLHMATVPVRKGPADKAFTIQRSLSRKGEEGDEADGYVNQTLKVLAPTSIRKALTNMYKNGAEAGAGALARITGE